MGKKIKISRFSLLGFFVAGSISTLLLTSCGVEQKIIDNLVDRGDGNYFAKAKNNDDLSVTLKEEIIKAFNDKTSTGTFKTSVVNKLLYEWFKLHKDEYSIWKDKWDEWDKSANDTYDTQLNQSKDTNLSNWPYYFQNNVLDPVGGTKDSFIMDQIYNSVRSFFSTQVFQDGKNYLSIASSPLNGSYDPTINVDTTPPIDFISGDLSSTNVKRWEDIDFFGKAVNDSFNFNKERNADYAQIQHKAFEMMTQLTNPVATSMTLWKYDAKNDDLKNTYNAQVLKDNTVPTTSNYEFPYISKGDGQGPSYGSNQKFYDFYNDGFDPGSTPNYYGAWTGDATSTGIIRVRTSYTDDSSCLFRVNLASDAFTKLDVTYASSVSDLWNAYTNASGSTSLPKGLINPNSVSSLWTADIMKNFLFTGTSGVNPIASVSLSSDNSFDLSSIYESVDLGGNLGKKLKIFNNDDNLNPTDWYRNGYYLEVPAFQLKTASSSNLPFIFIRENPGIHVIGLDGAGYLSAAYNATDGSGFHTQPKTQERENVILKVRCLQDAKDDPYEGKGFDFTKQSGDLNSFFTENMNDVLLSIANDAINNPQSWNMFDKIFNPAINDDISNFKNNWQTFFALVTSINNLFYWQTAVTNYSDANKNLFKFSETHTANALWGSATANNKLIYNNGLAACFPFVANSGQSLTPDYFNDSFKYDYFSYYDITKVIPNTVSKYITGSVSPTTISIYDLQNTISTNADTLLSNIELASDVSKDDTRTWSENILIKTNSPVLTQAINYLVSTYGKDASFSNDVKNKALNYWLESDEYKTDNILSDYKKEIASQFLTDKIISSTQTLSSLTYGANINANGALTSDQLVNVLWNEWERKNNTQISWNNGTASELFDYYKFLASIKYVHGSASTINYGKFISWLKEKIGNSYEPAYIAWLAKDNTIANENFKNVISSSSEFNNIYGGVTNYANAFNSTYVTPQSGSTQVAVGSYVDSSTAHYHFCEMPVASSTITGFGFLGLQTKSVNTFPSAVTTALFDNWRKANPNDTNLAGALYQYRATDTDGTSGIGAWRNVYQGGSSATNDDGTNTLVNYIASKCTNVYSLQALSKNFSTALGNKWQTQDNLINRSTSIIDPTSSTFPSLAEKKQIFINIITNSPGTEENNTWWANFTSDNNIPTGDMTNYLTGINKVSSNGVKEIFSVEKNPSEPNVIYEDQSAHNGDRLAIMQINYEDVSKGDENEIISNLETKFGANVIKQLIIQCAVDTSTQNKALSTIINTIYGDDKGIIVYDRRFNDQLGKTWVKNFKDKN